MAGGDTGDRIDCLPAHAVDTYSNSDAYSHTHAADNRAYPHTYSNTFARTHGHSHTCADGNSYSHIYSRSN